MLYSHKNEIRLRKVDHSDLEPLLSYKKESWMWTHRVSTLNTQDQESWFQKVNNNPNCLVLIAERDVAIPQGITPQRMNQLISQDNRIGLYILDNIDWPNGTYSMSYGVFKQHRGKGNGSNLVAAGVDFGFEIMNFRRAECEVLSDNVPSIRCVEKAGFLQEGVKRQAILRCGYEINSVVYGILRSDWRHLQRIREMDYLCNVNYMKKG